MSQVLELRGNDLLLSATHLHAAGIDIEAFSSVGEYACDSLTGIAPEVTRFLVSLTESVNRLAYGSRQGAHLVSMLVTAAEANDHRIAAAVSGGFVAPTTE